MTPGTPDRTDAQRRARVRTAMIFSGLVDLAFAGFFLGWGPSVLGMEQRVAWLLAAGLALFGIVTIVASVVAYGRRSRTIAGGGDDEPVIRR